MRKRLTGPWRQYLNPKVCYRHGRKVAQEPCFVFFLLLFVPVLRHYSAAAIITHRFRYHPLPLFCDLQLFLVSALFLFSFLSFSFFLCLSFLLSFFLFFFAVASQTLISWHWLDIFHGTIHDMQWWVIFRKTGIECNMKINRSANMILFLTFQILPPSPPPGSCPPYCYFFS